MADRCDQCGFEWGTPVLEGLRIIDRLPGETEAMVEPLSERAYERPEPNVWSPVEYIWHMADTFRASSEWMHDIRVLDHPTHYALDNDAMAAVRGYGKLSLETGLWALESACRSFIAEAAVTDPERTCYYHDWQDVTAARVVGFLAHEAVHHLNDLSRMSAAREATYAN